jgi:hypothetical protein
MVVTLGSPQPTAMAPNQLHHQMESLGIFVPVAHGTHETHPFDPASILEGAGIRACIVGDAVTIHFGSDVVLADLHIAIADEKYEIGCSVLRARGFDEMGMTAYHFAVLPLMSETKNWIGCRLSRSSCSVPVVVSPASCWQLDISPDTTFFLPGKLYRFPHFLPFLEVTIVPQRFVLLPR